MSISNEREKREDQATARPWRVSDSHGLCVASENGVVTDLDSRLVADPGKARTDAELIVKAVNSYEAMREALEGFLSLYPHDADIQEIAEDYGDKEARLVDTARAALALASKGGR